MFITSYVEWVGVYGVRPSETYKGVVRVCCYVYCCEGLEVGGMGWTEGYLGGGGGGHYGTYLRSERRNGVR